MMAIDVFFDLLVAFSLIVLGASVVMSRDLFRGVVLFISYGLVMGLGWVRLLAVDVALAEAAIGAGLTGALFFNALSQLGEKTYYARILSQWFAFFSLAAFASILMTAIFNFPEESQGLTSEVMGQLKEAGVIQPVTAVLLNFRVYDTWLELLVLLTAVIGILSLRRSVDLAAIPFDSPRETFLEGIVGLLAPLMVIASIYLLWAGTHTAGGAFQAGAVLGGSGIFLWLSGRPSAGILDGPLFRILLISGTSLFLFIGVATLSWNGALLSYRKNQAGTFILILEAIATASIGLALVSLFLGSTSKKKREKG
jgi:multisubunit Na+/H+ antiporter MnhB subunit